jgi:glycosyltransferase involved in cell wall biosynthesis
VDVFKKVNSNCELWLFGSGDYEDEIKKSAEIDNRIKFFGRVSRETVLKAEKEATLLLNLRNNNDDYTKYSFPSKMVEYMLSGTPLLTTALDGIPGEYYSFVYSVNENDTEKIALLVDEILKNPEEVQKLGEKAKNFVTENKNCFVQAEKIREFVSHNV